MENPINQNQVCIAPHVSNASPNFDKIDDKYETFLKEHPSPFQSKIDKGENAHELNF